VLAGAGGIALPLVVACRAGRSASPTKASAGGAPQRGGTLNISNNFNRGFDPHTVPASDTWLFGMFYSSLVRANPKKPILLRLLVEKLHQANSDAKYVEIGLNYGNNSVA